jgi:hypothetical protein
MPIRRRRRRLSGGSRKALTNFVRRISRLAIGGREGCRLKARGYREER